MRTVDVLNLFPAGTVLNANRTSSPQQLWQAFGYAAQVVITGTPTGSFKLQASCDPVNLGTAASEVPTNWSDIGSTSTSVSAAGSVFWNFGDIGYNWVRIVYTDTSGGSSAAVIASSNINVKGF